ncbi:MAG: TolC family protein [Thermodesulfovibrionales bacterium]
MKGNNPPLHPSREGIFETKATGRPWLKKDIKSCFLSVPLLFVFAFAGIATAAELTLAEGLRLATDNSRIIKIAEQDEEIAVADTYIERSKMMPVVNAGAAGTALSSQPGAIFGPNTLPLSQKEFLSYSLSIQHTLFDFRGNASRYEASRTRVSAKKFDRLRVKNLVSVDFALTYLDLLESQKMMAVAEKEVESLSAHVKDARTLFEEGVVTKNDLLQAEVKLSDARQRLLTAANMKSVNVSRLNNLLVGPLEDDVRATDTNLESVSPLENINFEKAWQTALAQRPEIKILDEAVKGLDFEETSRKAEYYPRLFVKGGYDFTQNRYQVPDGNWSLTLGLGINLFNGGATRAEIMKIEARRSGLLEQKNKIRDDIKLEVKKYLLDSVTARERMKVSIDAVRQAEENLRINRSRYEEGVGTATEVLDAVTLMTVAETNYHRSLYGAKKAEAAVLYAVGQDLLEVYK